MNEPSHIGAEARSENHLAQLRRLADAFGGRLAVAARSERTGESVRLAADEQMPTASVIKLAVLAAVFAGARDRTLSLDDRIALRDEDRVRGSGAIHELSAGTALTVRDLATLMVVVSDNMATNLLIDAVGGVENVNDLVNGELGLHAITLRRKLTFSDPDRGPLGLASPDDLVALIGGILAGRVVSPEASAEMLAILARQQYLDQVPRLFDRDALADELGADGRIAVACKTGMIPGVRADAGVVWLAGSGGSGDPVVYAVMSDSGDDGGRDLDSDAALVNAEVGRLLVRWFWPSGTGAGEPALAPHPAARWVELHRAADLP